MGHTTQLTRQWPVWVLVTPFWKSVKVWFSCFVKEEHESQPLLTTTTQEEGH